jgi:hypothetical protein
VSATDPMATVASTSVAPSTSPTTTPAPTSTSTAAPSSTATPDSTSVAPSSTLEVGTNADVLVVVWASGVVSLHEPDTGQLLDTVTTFSLEGWYPHDPQRGPDGTTYLGTSVEDSWYSCETAHGAVIALTMDGASTPIGPGGLPTVSADGERLAYVRSSECRPDPEAPEMFVVTVPDTVVVRELTTGEERTWTFPGANYEASLQPVVSSVVWHGDALLALIDGRLVRLDVGDPGIPTVSEAPVVELAAGDEVQLSLLGTRTDGTVLVNVIQGTTRIVALDPATGREVAEVATIDSATVANVGQSGMRWAAIADGTVLVDGSETILEVPPLPPTFVPDFEDRPIIVGW